MSYKTRSNVRGSSTELQNKSRIVTICFLVESYRYVYTMTSGFRQSLFMKSIHYITLN